MQDKARNVAFLVNHKRYHATFVTIVESAEGKLTAQLGEHVKRK